MGKWIRWWGLSVFVVLTTLFACVWIFCVDAWVKSLIEDVGTDAVGAKVELASANLSLFPAGLALTHLQVTNPKKPMTNVVEIANITMGLDGLNLLRRKLIVEEMVLTGVRLGTSRSTSGAIREDSLQEETSQMFSLDLPSLEVPDVKKIIEGEDLETLRLVETLKTDIKREKETWKSRLKQLPGKAKLAAYKKRVKNLKKAKKGGLKGILGGVEEVQSLKQDIEQEIESLKGAKKEFEEKTALLRTRFNQVKTAPKRDIQHLRAKYNLSPQGLANMSQTLLGRQIGSWARQGAGWYERAKPFLEGARAIKGSDAEPEVQTPLRGKGVDVQFKEAHPLPDFLIRTTKVSVNLDLGDLSGMIQNITSDQPTFGHPTTFAFSGEQLKGVKSVTVDGSLNHIVPTDSMDQITLQAKGYELKNVQLSRDAKWPVALMSGLGDMNIHAVLKGQALSAKGRAQLSSLKLSAGKEGDINPLTKALSSAVTGISQLSLEAGVIGTLEQQDVTVSSDLDRILQNAAGKMVNELAAKFSAQLQSGISAKIAEPMQDLKEKFLGFDGIAGDLTERVTQHNTVLKNLLEKSLPTKKLKGFKGLENLSEGLKLPF